MSNKLELVGIKTDDGRYYLCGKTAIADGYGRGVLDGFLVNGVLPTASFSPLWVISDSCPTKVSRMVRQRPINHRYELQDKELISEKLPEFIPRDEVATLIAYEWTWSNEMSQYQSLYKEIADPQPDKEEVIEFDLTVLCTVARVIAPTPMAFDVTKAWDESTG